MSRQKKAFDSEQIDFIANEYKKGVPIEEISRILKCRTTRISEIIKRLKLKRNGPYLARGGKSVANNQMIVDEVISLRMKLTPMGEISDKVGITRRSVYYILKKNNLTYDRALSSQISSKISSELINHVIHLYLPDYHRASANLSKRSGIGAVRILE